MGSIGGAKPGKHALPAAAEGFPLFRKEGEDQTGFAFAIGGEIRRAEIVEGQESLILPFLKLDLDLVENRVIGVAWGGPEIDELPVEEHLGVGIAADEEGPFLAFG